jgi:hypothetical protein
VDAVELEETAVVFADLLLDFAVPPVGCQAEGLVFGVAVESDVVRATQADDIFARGMGGGVAAGGGVVEDLEPEFTAGVAQGGDVADLGIDGYEVGHGFLVWVSGFLGGSG